MARKANENLVKVQFNCPRDLSEKVKNYAEKLGITTTSAIIVLINQGLQQQELTNQIPVIMGMYNNVLGMLQTDKSLTELEINDKKEGSENIIDSNS